MINKFRLWLSGARPKTLLAGLCPVCLGALAVAKDSMAVWWPFYLALMATLFIQVGTNYANDYFDYMKGADTDARLGPDRLTQKGWVRPEAMKWAFILCFFLAFLFGLGLIYRGGWPILWIGLASIAAGILYTGGPFPFAYRGLGEVFVLIFFGPVAVAGTAYVMTLSWSVHAVVLGLSAGMIATGILVVNNLRDRHTDVLAGKRTLAVRFGRRFSIAVYGFFVVGASTIPLITWWQHPDLTYPWHALSLFMAVILLWQVSRVEGKALNPYLGKTGLLLLVFTLLFAVSQLIDG